MDRLISTFSIIGFDPQSQQIGVATQSKFFAVGTTVPWVRVGVGAVATQAFANIEYGPRGLELLLQGVPPQAVVARLIAEDENAEIRQVAVMNAAGQADAHTGLHCMPWAGHVKGRFCTVQGNILVGPETVLAMVQSFEGSAIGSAVDSAEGTAGSLAERLVAALAAGQQAGGDRRGRQSAALVVGAPGDGAHEHLIDIRVDDHPQPIDELGRLVQVWKAFFQGMLASDEWVTLNEDITLVIQSALKRSGYFSGDVTGRWSASTAQCLAQFARESGLAYRVSESRVSGDLFRAVFDAYQRLRG